MTTDEEWDRRMTRLDEMTGRLTTATEKLIAALKGGATTDRQSAPAATGGATFPNYGRSKNQPVAGASSQDLEYYAAGCRRTLDDPGKSRWHDRERVLLAAITAEIARQGGGEPESSSANLDDDVPF